MNFQGEEEFHMDLSEYAKNYKGRNLILRLLHIARNCTRMELEALRAAYDLMRWRECVIDLSLFKCVVELINGRLGQDYLMDINFVQDKKKMYEKLEHKYKTNAMEPNQWKRAVVLLHSFRYESGALADNFQPCDQYGCMGMIEVCMAHLLVALEARKFTEVGWLHADFEHHEQRNVYEFKHRCAIALAHLRQTEYMDAAHQFLERIKDADMCDYSELISSEDIIMYGLLCAMVRYDHPQLQVALNEVMEPAGVAYHLREIVKPSGIVLYLTEIIKHFLEGRFTTCIELFEKQRPRLLLDFHLSSHVDLLIEINDVMVAAYLKTFSMILLDHYTIGFVDPSRIENEEGRIILDSGGLVVFASQVVGLIRTNKIEGRISVNQDFM